MADFTIVEKTDALRHMLGVGSHIKQREWGFRNYFCAGNETTDYRLLREMESDGLVREYRRDGDQTYFTATESGCQAIGLTPQQIKRAQS